MTSLAQNDGLAATTLHIRWRGQISGPYPMDVVVKMFKDNRITKHHEVSEDRIHWLPILRLDIQTQPLNSEMEKLDNMQLGMASSDNLTTPNTVNAPYIPPLSFDCDGNESADGQSLTPLMGIVFKTGPTPWILAFGLGPLVFVFLQSVCGLRFVQTAWLFSAYFCALWAWILGSLINEGSALWRRGLSYAVFTAFIGILMLLAWQTIPIIAILYSNTETMNPLSRMLGFVLGVGLFEEFCKVAPLLLFGLQSGKIRSAGDGLFLGMMSGLGFAMSEGVEYTIKYWSSAAGLNDTFPALVEQYGVFVVAQLTRFMSLPLLHAVWAGLVGYGVAKAFREGRWNLLFAGLGIAAILHGLYDFYSPGVLSLAIAALSIALTLALIVREARFTRGTT